MAADTLTRLQLAKRWRLHPNTLANWATWGKGPAFTAPKSKGQGQKGSYLLTDVQAWEKANADFLLRVAARQAARPRTPPTSKSAGRKDAASRAGDRPR